MSQFIAEANKMISQYVSKLEAYGNAYAFARAQGKDPWGASSACSSFEKGLTQDALLPVRRVVDKMIEERNAA